MIFLGFIIVIILVFVFRRISRRKALEKMSLKPFRYQMEVRRSPWANRGGF